MQSRLALSKGSLDDSLLLCSPSKLFAHASGLLPRLLCCPLRPTERRLIFLRFELLTLELLLATTEHGLSVLYLPCELFFLPPQPLFLTLELALGFLRPPLRSPGLFLETSRETL